MSKIRSIIKNLTPTKTLLLGYCVIILLGSALLSMPVATRAGAAPTSFVDALFTATSSTCVTGLVVFDTFTHWSLFGQLVILILIQIGGIGFMTFAISFISLTKRKIGVNQRVLIQESVSAPNIGGIIRMTRFIFVGSLGFELLGAILLSFYYCPLVGFGKGLYFSVFHSISAFCNAGFDLMGAFEPSSSLTSVSANAYVNIIIMLLIIIGGLGFFVWGDIVKCRFRFKKYSLHSKMVIFISGVLIVVGAVAIFIFETGGQVFEGKSVGERILISLFQSVTPRTAGFNTVDLSQLSQASQLLIIVLMTIGGSPGSTAGGMKTTTFAVVMLSVFTTFRRKKSIECFKRRIDDETLRTASCVLVMYVMISIVATLVIASIEQISAHIALFEVASAIGTVGLTLGVTSTLGTASKIILALIMLFGRAGSLTILLAFSSSHRSIVSKLPLEKVQIG